MSRETSPQYSLTSTENNVFLLGRTRVGIKERVTRVKKNYDLFMFRHGRVVADLTTDSRRVGAVVEAGFTLADMKKSARAATVVNLVGDIFDGHAARKHEHGGTADGARRDQQYDKERSFLVEAAQVARGRLDWRHLALRLASDVAMNTVVRPYFAKRGIDTKAGWAGKASTGTVSIAEFSANTDSNPQGIQIAATGAKIGRVGIYATQWGIELWRKNKEERESKAA